MKFSGLVFFLNILQTTAFSARAPKKSNLGTVEVTGEVLLSPVELPPQVQAIEIAHGAWKSQAMRSFVSTGLADSMGSLCQDGKFVSTSKISEKSSTKADPTYRLLRFLATFDVVVENDKHEFTLGPVGEVCVKSHPNSVANVILWEASETCNRPWLFMDDFLQENQPVVKEAFGTEDYYSFIVGTGKPFAEFQSAMTHFSNEEGVFLNTPFISPTFDLSSYDTICDLGCAEGAAALAMNKRYPNANYILADLPESVARIEESSLPSNFETAGIDFTQSVPKADAYFLKHVIHNSDDAKTKKIFENIQIANPEARIFVAEFGPMTGPNVPHLAKGFDLHMGLHFGAAERTQEQYDKLWMSNGLELVQIHMLGGGALPLYVQELKASTLKP